MKIVHIITRLILGGAQENTLITCKLLAERGHDVTLITGPAIGPEGQLFDQTKGRKYRTVVIDEMRRAIEPIKDTVSYVKLKRLLRDLEPDIVHTHSAKAGILGRFAGWSLKGAWAQDRPKRATVAPNEANSLETKVTLTAFRIEGYIRTRGSCPARNEANSQGPEQNDNCFSANGLQDEWGSMPLADKANSRRQAGIGG